MTVFYHADRTRRALATLAAVALFTAHLPTLILGQDDPSRLLDQANADYDFGEYQNALDLLDGIPLDDAVPAKTAFDVHVLRGRCLVGLGNNDLARESFCAARLLDQEWQPDPVLFLPAEVEVYASSLDGCSTGGGKPWKWIAAGVVALGGALVILTGGGEDDPQPGTTALPGFPDMPSNKAGGP